MWPDVRKIAALAWPVLIGQLAIIAFGVIDTAMVGRYSATDLAALGLGSSIYISVYIGLTGILMALQPIAGQLFGARAKAEIGEEVRQAFWLAAVLSVIGFVCLYFPSLCCASPMRRPPCTSAPSPICASCRLGCPRASHFASIARSRTRWANRAWSCSCKSAR